MQKSKVTQSVTTKLEHHLTGFFYNYGTNASATYMKMQFPFYFHFFLNKVTCDNNTKTPYHKM